MAILHFNNVGIKALTACVPKEKAFNKDLSYLMPEDEVSKIIDSVGIKERRICDSQTFASDLCYEAAIKLLADNDIDPTSIDMLLFMSQCADYRIPATACILQERLGLAKECGAIDLTLGCSGYVYALSTAMAYASIPGINRVLLLDGETFSKIVNREDKANVPLYGDAGTATLIEKGHFPPSTFILHTDGSGEDAVKIPAAMRIPVTTQALVVTEREDGNKRNDLEVFMDGMEVFNFALRVVPKGVKELLKETNTEIDKIDYLVFHQANRFMTDFFVKKLKFDSTKVPYCIDRYGNTSSASIPLTIASELQGVYTESTKIIMAGFGAGLSWATASLDLKGCNVSGVVAYGE